MTVLEFIFQSFWHWIGTVILVGVLAEGIRGIVGAIMHGGGK
jgi:hypothetical protein